MKRGGALGYRNQIPGNFRRSNLGQAKASAVSALTAELHAGWILKFAFRAAHRQPPFLWADAEYRRNPVQRKQMSEDSNGEDKSDTKP
jgi:hypothetical protein